MKTAVSLPDDLFAEAEKLARKRKQTRSRLYADALRQFIDRQRGSAITEALDRVYEHEDGRVDPAWRRAQARSWGKERW